MNIHSTTEAEKTEPQGKSSAQLSLSFFFKVKINYSKK